MAPPPVPPTESSYALECPLPPGDPPAVSTPYTVLLDRDAASTPGNDIEYWFHPNGLCTLRLAPSHALIARLCHLEGAAPDEDTTLAVSLHAHFNPTGSKVKYPRFGRSEAVCSLSLPEMETYSIPAGVSSQPVDVCPALLSSVQARPSALLSVLRTQYVAILSFRKGEQEAMALRTAIAPPR